MKLQPKKVYELSLKHHYTYQLYLVFPHQAQHRHRQVSQLHQGIKRQVFYMTSYASLKCFIVS